MRSADCQEVGHLNATIKNSFFFVLLTHIFIKPDSPTVIHQSLPKLKKKKKYVIHGLAQVRIPAKIDVQHD